MKKNTSFVIPSLGRADRIANCTIKTLRDLNVPDNLIYVFVADDAEKKLYQEQVPEVEVVTGVLGIGAQRKFINNYFPSGHRIVSFDDDVTLLKKDQNKTVTLTGDLLKYVDNAYKVCEERGARLWCITDTTNGMFMRDEAVFGLRSCSGTFFGEYAQETDCQSNLDHCEDIEKQIKHFLKYGGIVRFNNVGPKQKRYAEGGVVQHLGGMDERLKVLEAAVLYLSETYPELVKIKPDYDVKKGMFRIKNITHERFNSVF
jgi:hypothetical protein